MIIFDLLKVILDKIRGLKDIIIDRARMVNVINNKIAQLIKFNK